MSTLNFEVGKAYQTRDGRKAVCLTTTLENAYPLAFQVDGSLYKATIDGCDYVTKSESPKDIVGEWIDKPVIDWSLMPAWAKFVAMDNSGCWYWYINKIRIKNNYWEQESGFCGKIPTEYAPKWEGDWQKSLIERP
jgi:hypothetical protein